MSFRGVDKNLPEYVRSLQDQINSLRKEVGQARQNTIRLGNWVVDVEDDKKIRMTNLATGDVTYAGDQTVPFVGSKEWSYSGVVAPNGEFDVVAPAWCCPYPITVTHCILQFQTAPVAWPYVIHTKIGDGVTIASTTINPGQTKVVRALNSSLKENQNLYPVMEPNPDGDGENFSVTYWYTGVYQGEL